MKIEHIPRWIFSSLSQHFLSQKRNYSMYVEGFDKISQDEDSFEFRQDDPDILTINKKYHKVVVDVNILVRSMRDQQDDHKHAKMIGIMLKAFVASLPVYKFGDGADDDENTVAFCLTRQDTIRTVNFGLVQATNNIIHSTVESGYVGIITEELT